MYPAPPPQDPRTLPPPEVTRQASGWAEWAEALSSGSPFNIAKAALQSLDRIRQNQDAQYDLQRKMYEHLRNPPKQSPKWVARGFRYDPADGVRRIGFGQASQHTHLYIQTVKTGAGDGQFYISLTRTMNIDPAVSRPQIEDIEFLGTVGGKSETLKVALGSQNLWYWSNIAHDGILMLATSADALPGG